MKITKIAFFLQFITNLCIAQQDLYFKEAYDYLNQRLEGKTYNFKECVFEVENAYFEGKISFSEFDSKLNTIIKLCKMKIEADSI